MSLDNVQLTPGLIQQLYKDSLVEISVAAPQGDALPGKELPFLGSNKKNILILVNAEDAVYLPDEDLNFFIGIISACKLNMQDVALVNVFNNPGINNEMLLKQFDPQKIIFFGIQPAALSFPLQFPQFQLQHYNNQTYLWAPHLGELSINKERKKSLWDSLQLLFELKK